MKFFVSLIFALIISAVPNAVFAQGGLVPECSTVQVLGSTIEQCDFCDLVQLFNNVIRFIIQTAIVLFVMVAAYAGFKLVVSQGNPTAMNEAKQSLVNLLVGFIIMLSAWLVIDTLMKVLVNEETLGRPWERIACGTLAVPTARGQLELNEDTFQDFDAPDPSTTTISILNSFEAGEASGAIVVSPDETTAQVSVVDENGQIDVIDVELQTFTYPSGLSFQAIAISSLPNPEFYTVPGSAPTGYVAPQYVIPLTSDNLARNVSQSFTLAEVTNSAGQSSFGFVAPYAVAGLQAVRQCMGTPLSITSGYRPPAHNAAIGAASHSRHMYGDAFDISWGAGTKAQLVACCQQNGAGYVNEYASWVHCDWRNGYRP